MKRALPLRAARARRGGKRRSRARPTTPTPNEAGSSANKLSTSAPTGASPRPVGTPRTAPSSPGGGRSPDDWAFAETSDLPTASPQPPMSPPPSSATRASPAAGAAQKPKLRMRSQREEQAAVNEAVFSLMRTLLASACRRHQHAYFRVVRPTFCIIEMLACLPTVDAELVYERLLIDLLNEFEQTPPKATNVFHVVLHAEEFLFSVHPPCVPPPEQFKSHKPHTHHARSQSHAARSSHVSPRSSRAPHASPSAAGPGPAEPSGTLRELPTLIPSSPTPPTLAPPVAHEGMAMMPEPAVARTIAAFSHLESAQRHDLHPGEGGPIVATPIDNGRLTMIFATPTPSGLVFRVGEHMTLSGPDRTAFIKSSHYTPHYRCSHIAHIFRHSRLLMALFYLLIDVPALSSDLGREMPSSWGMIADFDAFTITTEVRDTMPPGGLLRVLVRLISVVLCYAPPNETDENAPMMEENLHRRSRRLSLRSNSSLALTAAMCASRLFNCMRGNTVKQREQAFRAPMQTLLAHMLAAVRAATIEGSPARINLLCPLVSRLLRTHRPLFVSLFGRGKKDWRNLLEQVIAEVGAPEAHTTRIPNDISRWLLLAQRLLTKEWDQLVGMRLHAVVRTAALEEDALDATLARRRVAECDRMYNQLRIRVLLPTERLRQVMMHAEAVHEHHRAAELKRRTAFRQLEDESRLSAMRQWHRTVTALTHERGPWSLGDTTRMLWKLDKTETASRTRIRLRRAYNASDHAGCVKADDGTPREQAPSGRDVPFDLPIRLAAEDLAADAFAADTEFSLTHDEALACGLAGNAPGAMMGSGSGSGTTGTHQGGTDAPSGMGEDTVLFSATCSMVTMDRITPGTLELTATFIKFVPDRAKIKEQEGFQQHEWETVKPPKDRQWRVVDVKDILPRRYLLRPTAVEIFLVSHRNFFLNFEDSQTRVRAVSKLVSLRPPNLTTSESNPVKILERSNLTQLWQRRLISNFDYLIQLNSIAGRTYNDLMQYPVFPWVIADYTSAELDLNDPQSFRILSRPIAVQHDSRHAEFIERYNEWPGPEPKFHYGSHYSSEGVVLGYLLRLEPFTTLFLNLQGGHFDHPDRMFHDIGRTYQGVTHHSSDVKELIPEFFYQPDMFRNINGLQMGVCQNGTVLGDIQLPPWAKGSPEEFVRLNRAALESDYVSAHLHEWIDLIFGYKQQGPAAVEAINVFYYTSYENKVLRTLARITDPVLRASIEAQIANFGQTPSQIMTRPHPPRHAAPSPIPQNPQAIAPAVVQIADSSEDGIAFVSVIPPPSGHTHSRVVVVTCSRAVGVLRATLPQHAGGSGSGSGSGAALSMTIERDRRGAAKLERPSDLFSVGLNAANERLGHASIGNCFACAPTAPTFLISCGHWDNTIKATQIDDSGHARVVQSVAAHTGLVTCVAVGQDGNTIATGSDDTTVMIWRFHGGKLSEKPLHVLTGHDADVTCLALDTHSDLVVSGSKDATLILHSARTGRHIRSVALPSSGTVDLVALSPWGLVAAYSLDDLMLHVFALSGNVKHLASADTCGQITALAASPDGRFLFTGGHNGMLTVRTFHSLKVVSRARLGAPILSLALHRGCLVVGLGNGRVFAKRLILPATDP